MRVAVLPEGTGGVMADDLKQTGKPDDAKINVEQEHEVKHWSEKFGSLARISGARFSRLAQW
jgi:hypothetical protein